MDLSPKVKAAVKQFLISSRLMRPSAWAGLFAALAMTVGCRPATTPHAPSPTEPAPVESRSASDARHVTESELVAVRVDGKPVSAVLRLPQRTVATGTQFDLTVELQIAPSWEIRTLDDDPAADAAATRLELTLPPGISAVGEWAAPDAIRSASPDGHAVYIGKATFTRMLAIDASATKGMAAIACRAEFQACDERTCLRPQAVELSAEVVISHP